MKNSLIPLVLILSFFMLPSAPRAEEPSLGETLVRDLWKDIAEGNLNKVEQSMAPEFQSVHEDIARNKTEELELLKNAQLGEYELTDFEVTQTDTMILVTYRAMVEEMIAGNYLPARTTMRLSLWVKTGEGWKWAAHANLNPFQTTEEEPEIPARDGAGTN